MMLLLFCFIGFRWFIILSWLCFIVFCLFVIMFDNNYIVICLFDLLFVNDLYYNYITLNIDNRINGYELFIGDNREFTKNWYCGKRTTKYQAKRFFLNELLNLK